MIINNPDQSMFLFVDRFQLEVSAVLSIFPFIAILEMPQITGYIYLNPCHSHGLSHIH